MKTILEIPRAEAHILRFQIPGVDRGFFGNYIEFHEEED